jgi:hypothetical protein
MSIEPFFDEMWRLDSAVSSGGLSRYSIGAPISPVWMLLHRLVPDFLDSIHFFRFLTMGALGIGLAIPIAIVGYEILESRLDKKSFLQLLLPLSLIVILLNSTGAYFGLGRYFNNYGAEILSVSIVLVLLDLWSRDRSLERTIWYAAPILVLTTLTQAGATLIVPMAVVCSAFWSTGLAVRQRIFRLLPALSAMLGVFVEALFLRAVRGRTELTDLRGFWAADALSLDGFFPSLWRALRQMLTLWIPANFGRTPLGPWETLFLSVVSVGFGAYGCWRSRFLRRLALSFFGGLVLLATASLSVGAPFMFNRVTTAAYLPAPVLAFGGLLVASHHLMSIRKILFAAIALVLVTLSAMNIRNLENVLKISGDSQDVFARGLLADVRDVVNTLETVDPLVSTDDQLWIAYHPMSHWYVRYQLGQSGVFPKLLWENWGQSEFYEPGLPMFKELSKFKMVVCVVPWEVGPGASQQACQLDGRYKLVVDQGMRRASFRVWSRVNQTSESTES